MVGIEENETFTSKLYWHKVNFGKTIGSEEFMKEIISLAGEEGKTIEGKFSFSSRFAGDGSRVSRRYSFVNPEILKGFSYVEFGKYDSINPSEKEVFEDMASNMKFYSGGRKFTYDGNVSFKIE